MGRSEFVSEYRMFQGLYGYKRQGHPDYQDIDRFLRKDYNEKFKAQGPVAQSLFAEHNIDDNEFEFGNMFDDEFEFEEFTNDEKDMNEIEKTDDNGMDIDFPNDIFQNNGSDAEEISMKEPKNDISGIIENE